MSYGRAPLDIDGMTSVKVDNLTYRTSPETLRYVFEKYGRVGDIYIPCDRYTKESRGLFVVESNKRDAEDAMDAMDGALLDGRELRVQMARYGRPPDSHHGGRRGGTSGRRYSGSGRRSRSPRRRRRSRSRSRSCSRSRSRSKSRSRSYSRSKSRSPRNKKSKVHSPSRSRSRSRSKLRSRSRSRSPSSKKGSRSRSKSQPKRAEN